MLLAHFYNVILRSNGTCFVLSSLHDSQVFMSCSERPHLSLIFTEEPRTSGCGDLNAELNMEISQLTKLQIHHMQKILFVGVEGGSSTVPML